MFENQTDLSIQSTSAALFSLFNITVGISDMPPFEPTGQNKMVNYLTWILEFLILIGCVGNLLNLLVFSRAKMRQVSTFRYLCYLSLFDLLVLMICASEVVLRFGYQFDIRSSSIAVCRVHTFLTYSLTHLSSILLMVVSIDRAVVINRSTVPSKRGNRRKAKSSTLGRLLNPFTLISRLGFHPVDKVIILILILVTVLNSHYLIFLNLNEFKGDFKGETFFICYPAENSLYNTFLNDIWTWIDTSIYSVVPFVVMAVCSYVILISIRKKSQKFLNGLLEHGNQTNKQKIYKRIRRNRQVFYMLLLTNFYFLASLLPCCIAFAIFKGTESRSEIGQLLVHLLLYSNYSFNFIFYGVSSQRFREELRSAFGLAPARHESVKQ
nr:G protein-coupled receptor [Proales similis]